jgi:hypothetical protein
MTEIVSLRRARKARDRTEREAAAAANRVAFGRTKADRVRDAAARGLEQARLSGHRLDAPGAGTSDRRDD